MSTTGEPTTKPCFNCHRADDVAGYSFDLDLPTIHGCKWCLLALSMGDHETLAALKPRQPKKTPRRST